jgi:molecular chaperone GrpE
MSGEQQENQEQDKTQGPQGAPGRAAPDGGTPGPEAGLAGSTEANTGGAALGAEKPAGTASEQPAAQAAEPGDEDGKKSGKAGARLKELEARLKTMEEERADLKDQLLRKQADFENFRKRLFREKDEAIAYANSLLLQDLIPVLDDLERAIASAEAAKDFEGLYSGVALIFRQFLGVLDRKYALKRFDSTGQEFDPDRHEALAVDETQKSDRQMVLEDYLKGYTLNERVLRHAKVRVSGLANE